MPDIDAPNPTDGDAPGSVDDLLRDIGAACGVGLDEPGSGNTAPDWFARAVDALASGRVPDLTQPDLTRPPEPATAGESASPVANPPSPDRAALELQPPGMPAADEQPSAVAAGAAPASEPSESLEGAFRESARAAKTPADDRAEQAEADPLAGAVFVGPFTDETGPAPDAEHASPLAAARAGVTPEAAADLTADTTSAPVAGTTRAPVAAPVSASVADEALRRLDDELAEDVEDLLRGNFDTVSAVLDDSFDDRSAATARPEPGTEPGTEPNPEREPGSEVASRGQTAPSRRVGTGLAEPEHAAQDSPGPVLPARSAGRGTGGDSGRGAAAGAEPLPEAVFELMDPTAAEPVSQLLPDRPGFLPTGTSPVAEAEPEPETAPDPATPQSEAADERIEAPAPFPTARGAGNAAPSGLQAILIEVLAILGYPLRFVPPSVRPLVDWVALSLVFWVPIVWVIALFMVGQRV